MRRRITTYDKRKLMDALTAKLTERVQANAKRKAEYDAEKTGLFKAEQKRMLTALRDALGKVNNAESIDNLGYVSIGPKLPSPPYYAELSQLKAAIARLELISGDVIEVDDYNDYTHLLQ